MSAPDLIYVAEVPVYDPLIPGVTTKYYASATFNSKPADTPSSQHFSVRLGQPAFLARHCFADGTSMGASDTAEGDLELMNDDAGLDVEYMRYGLDGRIVTVRAGVPGSAYPGGFTTVQCATMENVDLDRKLVTIRLKDRQQELDLPLQSTKYAGTNALPAGLEGTASDLKGKPKPICFGVVSNVQPPCVNTSKLIYQVNDAAINSVDAVYDRGIALLAGLDSWSSVTTGFGANTINAFIYGNGVLLAAGDAGTLARTTDFFATKTNPTSGFGATNIAAGIYAFGLYIIGGGAGTLATSPDGTTWTSRTSQFGASGIQGFCLATLGGVSTLVAVGAGGKISTSTNGTTWTARTSGVATTLRSVAADGVKTVVVGDSGVALSSTDGATWTANVVGITSGVDWYAILYGGSKWIAANLLGVTATSLDGFTFAARATSFSGMGSTAKSIYGLAYGNGQYLYVGNPSSSPSGATSIDGEVWQSRAMPNGAALNAAIYAGGYYFVGGAGGVVSVAATGAAAYASQADLLDDTLAPALGTFKYYSSASGSYFRLGDKPKGTITADVTQGANAAARTTAQGFKAILTRAGKSSSDYSASDITALDAAAPYVIGYWSGTEETTFRAALEQMVPSAGSWYCPDRTGVFRIQQLVGPSGSPVASFTDNDCEDETPNRVTSNDPGAGLPVYSQIVQWGKNYTVQSSDLAIGVTDARRAFLVADVREAKYTDTSVQTAHLLSPEITEASLLTAEADAITEAQRRQVLRGVRRDIMEIVVELTLANLVVDVGNVVRLTSSRFGLSGGKLFVVLGVEPDASQKRIRFLLWG